MLIPSIDLMGGRIVQLVQGEKQKLAFDDFEYWIGRFIKYPLVQLIDLDAAMRQGNNTSLVEQLCKRLPCQVGGGIGTVERARTVLAAGARRVIVGSSLFREKQGSDGVPCGFVDTDFAEKLSSEIGIERIVAGVDARGGKIAIKGWKDEIAMTPEEAVPALEPFAAAFLYTHIDGEGLMRGFPMEIAARLRRLTKRQLIVAGGIRSQEEIDALAAIGVDAVAGMAVYTNLLPA
jgi:phosphoribosylformimino-5-aminoimidazole carboxamide ribotide isomerase